MLTALKSIAAEALGLFVDDGAFAAAILAWIAVLGVIAPHVPGPWAAGLLFAGLAAILLESTRRRARR